jgi:hypothetical protein
LPGGPAALPDDQPRLTTSLPGGPAALPDDQPGLTTSLPGGPAIVRRVPLTGGGFAAVTRLDLADGRSIVLKVPPARPPLLAYEAGMAAAEAAYLRLVAAEAPEVPVPRLLAEGDGWLVMTYLPGTPLPELADGAAVRRDLGAAVLVSPALLRRIEREPDHPFLAGYGPVDLDPRRLGLYRVHLALLMLAEMPGRGMTDRARFRRITDHLEAELAALGQD